MHSRSAHLTLIFYALVFYIFLGAFNIWVTFAEFQYLVIDALGFAFLAEGMLAFLIGVFLLIGGRMLAENFLLPTMYALGVLILLSVVTFVLDIQYSLTHAADYALEGVTVPVLIGQSVLAFIGTQVIYISTIPLLRVLAGSTRALNILPLAWLAVIVAIGISVYLHIAFVL